MEGNSLSVKFGFAAAKSLYFVGAGTVFMEAFIIGGYLDEGFECD